MVELDANCEGAKLIERRRMHNSPAARKDTREVTERTASAP
jgi:hypothetical protein